MITIELFQFNAEVTTVFFLFHRRNRINVRKTQNEIKTQNETK